MESPNQCYELETHKKITEFQFKQIEDKLDRYDRIMESLTDTLRALSEKVVVLQAIERASSEQIEKLNDSNKLQTKLLVGIVTSSVVTLLTIAVKMLTGAHI
jgi:hypothetical protein